MDPERQPLLGPSTAFVRCRNRPLTTEEVLASRSKAGWRRTQLALALVFWAAVATLAALAVCSLLGAPPCRRAPPAPALQASLTLAPIVPATRFINHVYAT